MPQQFRHTAQRSSDAVEYESTVHSEGQGQELSVLGGILQQSNTNTQGEIHTRHMWGLAWLKNLLLVEVNLSFNNSIVTTSRSSTRDMPNPRETLTSSSLNEEVGSEERSERRKADLLGSREQGIPGRGEA